MSADEQRRVVATLSLAEINAIRSDCFADDIPIEHRMHSWDEHELRHFLETDGLEAPEWEERLEAFYKDVVGEGSDP